MEEGFSPRLGSSHSAAVVGSPRSSLGAKDYRDEIRNKRQLTVNPELQAQESLDALPMRMSEACTLRRTRPNSNNPAPYKITIVGPNDGSEAELVSAFVSSDGAPQPDGSPRSQRGDKESGSGDGASQEAVDLYLSSWKKKFNFAGKEYLLELHAGLHTQAETALDKGANVHIHDQFESSAGFMFLYDVTSRETFAEVMRVHSLIVRSKNVEKGKAKGLIPMIVLANTRNSFPHQPPPGGDSPSGSAHHPMVSVTAPDGSDVALSASMSAVSGVAVAVAAASGDSATATTQSPAREVTTEEGLEFAYACNCPFYEISSTTNYADVLNAFQQLLGEIIKDQRTRKAAADPASKLTQLGVKGNWRRSQLGPLVSSASSLSSYGASPPLSPLSSPPSQPRIEPVLPGSARGVDDVSAEARALAAKAQGGGLLTPTTTTSSSSSEAKEELHESLKDRHKNFRYSRVDTADIKYLPPLDAEPNSKPRIRAATLPKLIEKLTYPKYPDTDLVATFLLTYRSFTTPEELLHFVMRRYETTAPADLDKEGLRLWEASEMLPIRLRVINVLKSWISDHFYDFYDSKTLLDTLKDFVDKQLSVPTNLKGPLQQLKKSIETNEMERRARKEYMFSTKPPKSVISKKVAKAKPQEIDLRDIDPIEMARQLTLIDYDLLSRITAKEWLAHNEWATNKAKKRDDESKPAAPNLVAMINHFNCVSKWVATEIVKCAKIKHRVLLTKKFIEVAQHCLKLNNFNMLMAIVTGGLGNVSVYRLKYSWKSLPKKTLIAYEELRVLCDSLSNFNSLRTAIRTSVPPTIPYLGLYLSDLMYIEDGNADEVEGGLINFEKRRLKAEIIKDLQHFQTSPYCLTEIPVLQYYFRSLDHLSEAELYRMSCLLEPHSRQRGASIVNAPSRGMADQLSASGALDLLESSDGEIQVRKDSRPDSTQPDGAADRAARAQGVSSDEDLLGRDGGALALSSSPPPSSPFAQMTRAGGGFTPSGLMLSHFDVPLRAKAATGERDTERTPRVGAVLRAQAKLLEAVAATFSFADATRATAAVDILRRWEAQVASRKLFVVKDHSDFAGLDGGDDDDSGAGAGGELKGDNSNVDGQQCKPNGSKRKERARGEKGEKTPSSKLGQQQGTEEAQHHRTFGFEEVLMESRAVELAVERFLQTATVEGILEAMRADPIGGGWLAAFEAFLHKRLLGGQRPAFVTELLFALVKLLDKGPACFDAAAVAGMVGLYKKQPVRLAAHFVTDEAEAELADRHDRLAELEDREGVRTIQSYTKEVRLAFQILNLEKRILQAVKTSRPDGSMLYEALCVDREVWHRTQEVLLHTHSPKSPSPTEASGGRTAETTHKIIGELIQLVDKHLCEVSREDMQRFNESFEDALEEYFGWMGVYLRKLWDKLVLIHKRTEKIVQMKESSAKDSNAISKAANAWREKDLVHLHALIAAVDQAETTVNKFLESCPASSADGFDVTEDELKELLSQNNVFEQIIKMRRLQKTLEEQHARIADM